MGNFMKLAAMSVIGLCATSAQAVPVVTLSGTDATTTAVAGATTVNFNDYTCGAYTSCVGDYEIVKGSVSGKHAQPAGTSTPYLTVPYDYGTGSVTLTLGTNADYFGLFWGSLDTYNTITFLGANGFSASYSGSAIMGLVPNGSWTSEYANRYVNFDFGSDTFHTVVLTSNGRAFETDNHAFRVANVPEPGTLALLGLGMIGVGLARRREA